MRRRDISKAFLFASASGAAGLVETAQAQQNCTAPCYAITQAESAAGVTIAQLQPQYPPGDIRRYYNPAPGGDAGDWKNALMQLGKVGAHGVACYIPANAPASVAVSGHPEYAGTYTFSACPTNWAVSGLQVTGERGTVLQFVPPNPPTTGPIFTIDGDPSAIGSRVDGLLISNLTISGDSTRTDGLFLRGIGRSVFRNIEVRNCTGKAFNIRFTVGTQFDSCFFSTNVFNSTVMPTQGFCLDNNGNPSLGLRTTNCTFTHCLVEGMPGIGCELADAVGNLFTGCTFEADGIGLNIEDGCDRNRFVSTWFESNSIADVRIKGRSNHFSNCSFATQGLPLPSINVSVSTGSSTLFEGGYLQHVDLQSTSANTRFVGISDSFATITGTGTHQVF